MAFKFIGDILSFTPESASMNIAATTLEIAWQLSELVEQNKRIADALESNGNDDLERRVYSLESIREHVNSIKGATP